MRSEPSAEMISSLPYAAAACAIAEAERRAQLRVDEQSQMREIE